MVPIISWIIVLSLASGSSHSAAPQVSSHGGFQHYRVVPFNLDHLGGKQYFHIHITGTVDTEVEVTLHGTYLYRVASLSRVNDWSWHENIYISTDLRTAAYTRGFHIVADQPVTILLTRNCTVSQSLLTYTAFPLSHSHSEQFIIGSYPSYTSRWKSVFLVATGEEHTVINAYGPASDSSTLSNLTIADNTAYQYLVTKPRSVVGFRVVSSAPAAVFGGNQRTYLPLNMKSAFVPLFYQIPPMDHVGSQYVVGPLSGRLSPGQFSLFIVFCHENASVSITHNMAETGLTVTQTSSSPCVCEYNTTGTCIVDCHGNLMQGSHVEIRVEGVTESVMVNCSGACLVFTIMHSFAVKSHLNIGGSMALVAPAGLAPKGFHFFVPSVTGTLEIQHTWINIAVPTRSLEGVMIDGLHLTDLQGLLKYRENRVANWTVMTLYVEPGNHRVSHDNPGHVPMSVHVYGTVIPQSLTVASATTFGYPVAYPEPMEMTGTIHVNQPGINTETPIVSTLTTVAKQRNYYRLQVVICIILVAVFLAVLAIILIVIRNAAFLRVLLEYLQPEIPPDIVHNELAEKEKAGIESEVCASKHKTKEDMEMYLVPSSSRGRYVKQAIHPVTMATVSQPGLHEVHPVAMAAVPLPDEQELHCVTIPLPDISTDEDDNYDNIIIT